MSKHGWLMPSTEEERQRRVQLVIDALKAGVMYLDMGTWLETKHAYIRNMPDTIFDEVLESEEFSECGSVGCIGGLASVVMLEDHPFLAERPVEDVVTELYQEDSMPSVEIPVARWLGLDMKSSDRMFYPEAWDKDIEKRRQIFSKEQVVAVLEHYRDTNEVNWGILDQKDEEE